MRAIIARYEEWIGFSILEVALNSSFLPLIISIGSSSDLPGPQRDPRGLVELNVLGGLVKKYQRSLSCCFRCVCAPQEPRASQTTIEWCSWLKRVMCVCEDREKVFTAAAPFIMNDQSCAFRLLVGVG